MTDAVNNPAHYGGKDNPYEAIKVIRAWNLNFNTGNAAKYISRAGKKDPVKEIEDLQKAVWYLNDEIEHLKLIQAVDSPAETVQPNTKLFGGGVQLVSTSTLIGNNNASNTSDISGMGGSVSTDQESIGQGS